MQYSILTPHPIDCRKEIIQCVKNGEEKNGSNIQTWEVRTATFHEGGKEISEEVLVHAAQAWEKVGGLRLIVDKEGNSILYAKFFYWSDYPKDKRDESQPSYLYGRITELLLAYFMDGKRSVSITK